MWSAGEPQCGQGALRLHDRQEAERAPVLPALTEAEVAHRLHRASAHPHLAADARLDAKTTLRTYVAKLKAVGYSVTAATQDGEPVTGVYNAAKQDVKLIIEARQSWSANSVLAVTVRNGHPALPPAPAPGGVEATVPAAKQLTLMATGRNAVPQAFYALSPTGSVKDCIASFSRQDSP